MRGLRKDYERVTSLTCRGHPRKSIARSLDVRSRERRARLRFVSLGEITNAFNHKWRRFERAYRHVSNFAAVPATRDKYSSESLATSAINASSKPS